MCVCGERERERECVSGERETFFAALRIVSCTCCIRMQEILVLRISSIENF